MAPSSTSRAEPYWAHLHREMSPTTQSESKATTSKSNSKSRTPTANSAPLRQFHAPDRQNPRPKPHAKSGPPGSGFCQPEAPHFANPKTRICLAKFVTCSNTNNPAPSTNCRFATRRRTAPRVVPLFYPVPDVLCSRAIAEHRREEQLIDVYHHQLPRQASRRHALQVGGRALSRRQAPLLSGRAYARPVVEQERGALAL